MTCDATCIWISIHYVRIISTYLCTVPYNIELEFEDLGLPVLIIDTCNGLELR